MSIQETKALKQFESLLQEVIDLQLERKGHLDRSEELHDKSRQKFVEAVEVLRALGMGDYEISELTREILRNKIPKSSLKLYLSELKLEQSTSESGQNTDFGQNDDNNDTEQEQETTPEITVTTEGSQTSTPIELPTVPREPQNEEPKANEPEDPKDLEIQFLKEKVGHLEEALKKTEQFKPATQLQQQQEPITNADEHYFKWLTDKADGIHCFYYDTYGIDLFKNRELSQLKNSGVKVFKRLYFEV